MLEPNEFNPRMTISLVDASANATRSLGAPGIFALIFQTIMVTLLLLAGFTAGASWLAFHLSQSIATPWISGLIAWGGSIGAAIFAWMLFPGIMPVIVSFFGDKIATAIEANDYAITSQPRPEQMWTEVLHDIGFGFKAVGLNILCLPLYLVPVLNLCIFYVLNGYLLGREFFMMVARRHMLYAEAEQLRRKHSFSIFAGGVLFAFCATVPLVNLIAPFWGVALAVHLFHQVYDRKLLLPSPDRF